MRRNPRKKVIIVDQKKFLKSISILVLIILFCILLLCALRFFHFNSAQKATKDFSTSETNIIDGKEKREQTTKQENATFSMSIIGDIMCHNTQYKDAYISSTNQYDFSYVFENIKYYLQTADVAVGNLETTFAAPKKAYSSYPTFNSPEILAKNLKEVGMDVLSTSNNHSLDSGYAGVESTIKYLDEADISHTGTYTSSESQNKIIYKSIKGVKIAFLAFTYGTNGIPVPSDKPYCINQIEEELIKKQINLAKQEGAEVICVNMHWGQEYQLSPNQTQKDLADFLFQNGVDIILGSHPHVLQPMEKRTVTLADGTTKDGFVIYSLGNFMSGQIKENTKNSIILNLQVTRNGETGKISIDHAKYTPIYMYQASSGNQKFKILDIQKSIENYESGQDSSIGEKNYLTLKTELEKIKKTVGNEF